ncbi:hypothetical protein V2J09_004781 [Rumex salicifolius]
MPRVFMETAPRSFLRRKIPFRSPELKVQSPKPSLFPKTINTSLSLSPPPPQPPPPPPPLSPPFFPATATASLHPLYFVVLYLDLSLFSIPGIEAVEFVAFEFPDLRAGFGDIMLSLIYVVVPEELAIPAAVAVPDLMGSEGSGRARASGVGDAKGCDTARSLVFAVPKTEKSGPSVSKREYNANYLESSSYIKKADTESCRNTFQLSALPKENMAHELYHGSLSNSQSSAADHGSEGKHLLRKERRVPRTSLGYFKTPRPPQVETSMSTGENVDTKDACEELVSHTPKSNAEKSQPLKQKYNLNGKRGDRRNSKFPLKTKHDGLAGFSPACVGNRVLGTYGLKPDVHDITKLIDDISLDEILNGSYQCPTLGKEKGKRPANTSENILHSVRKTVSILQHRGLSLVNKQCDEIDVALSKDFSSAPTSNLSMSSNLDVDEESSLASDLSCPKVQEFCASTEAPPDTGDAPLYHPRDIIEKLALPSSKDLDSLLQDGAKLTCPRSNDPRPGKPVSGRVTLSSFSWSHNHHGHNKSNSDSVKVSSRSSCQGRWARIRNSSSFFGGGAQSFADLDSLTYDHSLVPSGSVKYILPQTEHTASKVSSSITSEQATCSLICSTSSPSPPSLQSPRAMTAAQALIDIASSIPNSITNGIIKWPKQPSQKAMKARKLKSIQSPENLLTPKSEMTLDNNTVRFVDHMTPLKKPKLLISEKRDHGHINAPKPPYFPSAPRSNRTSPTRTPRETIQDTNRHHVNGTFPKPLFKPPPRRVTEKTNHSHQKLKKVIQMDWNRGKSQL